MLKTLAQLLANSTFLKTGRRLWEKNQTDWTLPLSKVDKLLVTTHLVLADYANGIFPPTFTSREQTHDTEINFKHSLPGRSFSQVTDKLMRKPFCSPGMTKEYLTYFIELVDVFEQTGIHPPQRLLELGCGTGWMTEFLAVMGFCVVGTSISAWEIEDAKLRLKSLQAKDLKINLSFRTTPMEVVDQALDDLSPFDAVFVFEALHHAYSWQETIKASYNCLNPGGFLVIAQEPNVLHTFISYRVAKLANTHEIGLSRKALVAQLKTTGFVNTKIVKHQYSYFLKPHWIVTQRKK